MVFEKKEHQLVPKHIILNKTDSKNLLKKLNIDDIHKLPKIFLNDPAIKNLKPNPGDIIEITRNSYLGIKTKYWRIVGKKQIKW